MLQYTAVGGSWDVVLSETHGDGVHNPDAALSNVLLLVLQWVVVEQSCNCFSRVLVPLYDTLGPEAVSYIINQGWWLPPHPHIYNISSTS